MKKDDVKLIQSSLTGNENAFAMLVRKYQRQVHTLAWRKIKDFHIAEEITQDTFLIAYQKLATLKNPNCFAGWLKRIATRQCFLAQRKKRIQMQSLDDTDFKLIEKITYSQYVADAQAKAVTEARGDFIENLIARLPERERTVLRLHYFKEMTCDRPRPKGRGFCKNVVFTEAFVRSTTSAGQYQTDEAYCNRRYPDCVLKSTLQKVLSRMFQMGFRITGLSLLTTVSYDFQDFRF